MVCKEGSIHMKQCQGETDTLCVSLVMEADQVQPFCKLWPFGHIYPRECISIYPREKTFSILFCLMSCSQWHGATVKGANSASVHAPGPCAHLPAADRLPWKQPGKPTDASRLPRRSPLWWQFAHNSLSEGRAVSGEAARDRCRNSALCRSPAGPAPPRWHRNVCSSPSWPEYQCRPAMSWRANRKEGKAPVTQRKQRAGDERSQHVPQAMPGSDAGTRSGLRPLPGPGAAPIASASQCCPFLFTVSMKWC